MSCNTGLRSVIMEGQDSNGRFMDVLETEQGSSLEK